MPAAPPGEQNQTGSLDLIWVVAAVIIALLALWFFARGPVISVILSYKIFQAEIVGLFTPSLVSVQNAMEYYQPTPREVSIGQVG